jgi:hypothetical protein
MTLVGVLFIGFRKNTFAHDSINDRAIRSQDQVDGR